MSSRNAVSSLPISVVKLHIPIKTDKSPMTGLFVLSSTCCNHPMTVKVTIFHQNRMHVVLREYSGSGLPPTIERSICFKAHCYEWMSVCVQSFLHEMLISVVCRPPEQIHMTVCVSFTCLQDVPHSNESNTGAQLQLLNIFAVMYFIKYSICWIVKLYKS